MAEISLEEKLIKLEDLNDTELRSHLEKLIISAQYLCDIGVLSRIAEPKKCNPGTRLDLNQRKLDMLARIFAVEDVCTALFINDKKIFITCNKTSLSKAQERFIK